MTATFSLLKDERGQLTLLDAAGRRHENVEPIRAFPISDPEHWISLCDPNGREIVQIRDLAMLHGNGALYGWRLALA